MFGDCTEFPRIIAGHLKAFRAHDDTKLYGMDADIIRLDEKFGFKPERHILYVRKFTDSDGKRIKNLEMFKKALSRVDSLNELTLFYVSYWWDVTRRQEENPFGRQYRAFTAVLERLWRLTVGYKLEP